MADNELQLENDIVAEKPQERQYTPEEQKAMESGWVPKDQWQGDPDEWIPARTFNDRGEFFKRIARDKAKITQLEESVNALVEHNKKLFEAGYKRAIEELKREKQLALEEGDTRAVMEIDDRIEETREQAQRAKEEFEKKVDTNNKQTAVNPDFEAWHANNQWYLQDRTLTGFANGLAEEMLAEAQRAGKVPEWPKFYNEITRKVRAKFPEKFETRTRANMKTDVVDNGDDSTTVKSSTGSTLRESDLTEDQRRIMNNIIKSSGGKMTKKEYLAQMAEFEDRKGRR